MTGSELEEKVVEVVYSKGERCLGFIFDFSRHLLGVILVPRIDGV